MGDFDWIERERRRQEDFARASLRWRDDIASSISAMAKSATVGARLADRYRDILQVDESALASLRAGVDIVGGSSLRDAIAQMTRGYDQIGAGLARSIAPELATFIAQGTALASVERLQDQIGAISPMPRDEIDRYLEERRARFDDIVRSVRPVLLPAAFSSVFALEARLGGWDEKHRRYDKALAAHGWWFPPNLDASDFVRAGELALAGRKIPLRQHMAGLVAGPKARWLAESWLDEPLFRERRRFLLDGARDHADGRYRVSIPTLLPHIEGIAVAAFKGRSGDTNPRGAVTHGVATFGDAQDQALLEVVTFLWQKQDFLTFPFMSRRMNRHVVLHGRSLGYATEANSAQVLYALDHLHELVVAAGRLKAAA